MPTIIERLGDSLNNTEGYIKSEGYKGYDPYDGLQSPIFRLPGLHSVKILRWGFQQVLKRLPFQVRPLLGIPKGYNPVTLALVIQAFAYRDQASGVKCQARAAEVYQLVNELDSLRSQGFSGACWGYDFDWQPRHGGSIPAFYPTIVATGFVTNALFIAYQHYGIALAKDLILQAVPFILQDLNRTVQGNTFCWSYSPSDHSTVLNATMKGGRLLAQAVSLGGDPQWLDDAASSIRYVVERQRPDGSWPYSVGDSRSWADNFHTCYNIDALYVYEKLTGITIFHEALKKGLSYYIQHFFTKEGIPKYYDKSLYPIDATCCGQSLLTLVRFGYLNLADKVAHWVLEHMSLPDGGFKYQINHRYQNKIIYMRWSVAWLFAGLSRLELVHQNIGNNDSDNLN